MLKWYILPAIAVAARPSTVNVLKSMMMFGIVLKV